MTATALPRLADFYRDSARQVLNLVFALAQILVVVLGYALGVNATIDRNGPGDSPILPAGYAFAVWTPIFLGALFYALYQSLPAQRTDPLLRRIGFATAIAFAATTAWLLFAQRGWVWLTVVCIFTILIALVVVFGELMRAGAPRTATERFLVIAPISIFLGWITVACIANTAAALYATDIRDPFLPAATWTIIMLIVGGAIATVVTLGSRGNAWYALTVVWAFVAILVANLTRERLVPVAVAAGVMAFVILVVLTYARLKVAATRRDRMFAPAGGAR